MNKKFDKKVLVIIIIVIAIILGAAVFVFYNLHNRQTGQDSLGATAKCGDVFQCIDKLDPNSKIEDMNKIIGSDAELAVEDDKTKIYKWTLADDTTIEARVETYKNENTDETRSFTTLNINYPENFASHDANFSRWGEIQAKMDQEEGITYGEFIEMVGGIDGTITEKAQDSKKYQWFDNDGGYLSASFDDQTNKCTFVTGRI